MNIPHVLFIAVTAWTSNGQAIDVETRKVQTPSYEVCVEGKAILEAEYETKKNREVDAVCLPKK